MGTMSASNNPTLPSDAAQLADELAASRRQIEQLTVELSETNNGVVALYAELDDKNEQLRQASELKSRFLSYMSHEFRTPLGSIRSVCRLLNDQFDGPLNDEQKKQINFINNAAVELNLMVNDLLDLAAIEAGRITISPAWFMLMDFFAALRGMFNPILANTEVTLVFEEPVELSGVFTDDKKLTHILRNFISNAIKFTPHGQVSVTARRDPGAQITFCVADTGIGISPENLKTLFQDFAQVPSPLQKRLTGSGLGLSLSKRYAQLLGGSIAVESTIGVGSRFSVTIPITLPGHEPIIPDLPLSERKDPPA